MGLLNPHDPDQSAIGGLIILLGVLTPFVLLLLLYIWN